MAEDDKQEASIKMFASRFQYAWIDEKSVNTFFLATMLVERPHKLLFVKYNPFTLCKYSFSTLKNVLPL
jgi:hypothetical protein